MSAPTSESSGASPHANGSETVAFLGESYSKEERDIAFASQGLKAGLFNERQLKTALADWTIHGDTFLADHLQAAGLLTREDCQRLEAGAAAVLTELRAEQETAGGDSALGSTLQRLDESGHIAKLLGIAAAGSLGPSEARSASVRLTLMRKLGQGGLGTVWLARDENMQRYVALKEVTCTTAAAAAVVARFRREAEITGRLEHPGIVPVYEFGEDQETKRVFYTMRFLGKQTLQNSVLEYHERRQSGDHDPMLLRYLLTAFVSICQAIGHAHSRKVIHRDLKPENVAIDSFGQVIVIDWGLAKVLDETNMPEGLSEAGAGGGESSHSTVVGQVLGTPLYMAPEQAAGRGDEIDERTDIYGLGAILFAILTGFAPHERSQADSAKSGVRGLMTAIAGRPTPLARESNPDADAALEAICAKAMAKRRYARYQSATELADEVQHWMAGEPVRAYRETRMQRIGRWVQQHRRTSQALATLLIVALATGAIVAASSYHNVVAARTSRFEQMQGEAREIEVQFADSFDHLAKNVRFMSTVPPIQGIINARTAPAGAPPANTIESEETWRTRLEMIYEGLLRANRDYLAVTYLGVEMGSTQELVRVERHTTDPAFVRRVPKSRLAERKSDAFFETVSALNPGEVKLSIAEREPGASANSSRPRVLGGVPVYDETSGDVFGLVVVELDAAGEAKRILDRHAGVQTEVFITDGRGRIWVSCRPGRGVEVETGSANAAALVPSLKEFFDKEFDKDNVASTSVALQNVAPQNVNAQFVAAEDGVIADRIRLTPSDPVGSVGVVLRLAD